MNHDRKIRVFFLFLLLAHACFIIYGSLVPFTFESLPLSEAWAEFKKIITSPLGNFSRANLLANILIGIPGPFLLLGALHTRKTRPSLLLLAAALAYSALLASTAEFLQLFVPSRITALSDIAAQTTGGFMGLLVWLWAGPYIRSMLQGLLFADKNMDTGTFIFYSYLLVLLLLHILPMDLSPKLGLLYNQWQEGKIVLVPFSSWSNIYDVLSSLPGIFLWIPAGWYLTRVRHWSLPMTCAGVIAGIAFLEFMQLFVLSRTTDVTNIILAGIGGLMGALPGKKGQIQSREQTTEHKAGLRLGAGLFAAWLVFVLIIFWMPFTFTFEEQFLRNSVRQIGLVPLQLYTDKPYMHSALNMLSTTVYFVPLGVIFSCFVSRHFSGQAARAMSLLFLILAGLLAGIIEFAQVFIPERYADITDWMCMVAGAVLGHSISNMVWKRHLRGTKAGTNKDRLAA